MKRLLRHRPSPAMIVALIALFMALGGSAYAGVALSKGAVRSVHIQDRTVKPRDLAKNSVVSSKIKPDAVKASDIAAGAVRSSEIQNRSVTSAKLASPTYWAVVNGLDGALVRGTAGAASGILGGGYKVDFPVDVSQCAWVATPGPHTPPAPGILTLIPANAGAYVAPIDGGASPQSVFVQTYIGGVASKSNFHLVVQC